MTTERMTDDEFKATTESAYHGNEDGFHVLSQEAARARRVEQEQAEKIRKLEGKLALVMGERDAAETKAAHLEARLKVAHETISFAHDNATEQVRQARWEVAREALDYPNESVRWAHLKRVLDANAPKD